MKSPLHVCVITSAHDFNDDRIFHKQIQSFLSQGWKVTYVAKSTENNFQHKDFKHIEIPQFSSKIRRILSLNKLYKKAKAIQADVYHLHDPELILLARKLKKSNHKVVFDIHEDYKSSILASSLPFRTPLAGIWDYIEKRISKKLDMLVCADSYIKNRYDHPRKVLLGNYPPLSFTPKVLPQKPSLFTIVYAGGVNKARGVERLILATDRIRVPFRLELLGPCTDVDLLQIINSRSYITYHGKKDWSKVSAIIQKGSIGVALYEPSINFTYCTGEGIVKIFEYLGCGLPVVTSNFENLKSFIDLHEVGKTVDPMDSQEIAEAFEYYIQNPEELMIQSENGYRIVQDKFNWNIGQEELINAYKKYFIE